MKKLAELQQARASKLDAQKVLIEERKSSEGGVFSEEQKTRFEDLNTEIRNLDTQIAEEVMVQDASRNAAALAGASFGGSKSSEDSEVRKIKAAASISKAIRMTTTGKQLDGAEKEMNEVAIEESRKAGVEVPDNSLVNIPMSMLRATAQTVSEDAGNYGGQLVVDNAPRVQTAFAAKTILEELGATRLTGLTGGSVPLPVAGNYDFNWLGETEAIVQQKQTFTGPSLSPNRLGGAVDLSNRLLAQSSVNVEGMIRDLLLSGYNRAINSAAINGSGAANQPTGILNLAGVQQSSTTILTTATRAMLTELPALVEAANAGEGKFLLSPQLKEILQNIKTDAGSGQFLMDAANMILGFDAVSSTLVPELAGGKVLIYGDFSKMFIGEWGSISVLSDPYSAAMNNSVRLIVNAHADVAVAQPTAFAVNKFMTA